MVSSSVYSLPGIKVHNYNEHDLIKDVCDYFKITPEQIKTKIRTYNLVRPRQICMHFLLEKFPQYTFSSIGFMMGGFNHATVCHSRNVVLNDMKTNTAFREMVDDIRSIIDSHILDVNETKIQSI